MAFVLSPCGRELEKGKKGQFFAAAFLFHVAGAAEAAEQRMAPFEALHLLAETAKEVISPDIRNVGNRRSTGDRLHFVLV